MILKTGRVTVTTPGKPVRLSDVSVIARRVAIFALHANTSSVAVGDETVLAQAAAYNAPLLDAKDIFPFPVEDVDLSTIWVDARVVNEGVVFAATVP